MHGNVAVLMICRNTSKMDLLAKLTATMFMIHMT
jgi:hypothetical protein